MSACGTRPRRVRTIESTAWRLSARPDVRRMRWLVAALALALVLSATCPGRDLAAQEPGVAWTTRPAMPEPRSELAAAAIDGAIYVVGGFGGGDRIDRYDSGTETWERLADLPADLNHPGVAALDGLVYVAGGYDRSFFASAEVWSYDPAADAWTVRSSLPESRGALGLVALDGSAIAGTAEVYDPATDTWETRPALPTPRGGVAGVWVAGRFVTLGGETFSGPSGILTHADVEAYDPEADTWETLPPLPTPRHGLAAAAIGDTLLAIAGSTAAGDAVPTGAVEVLVL